MKFRSPQNISNTWSSSKWLRTARLLWSEPPEAPRPQPYLRRCRSNPSSRWNLPRSCWAKSVRPAWSWCTSLIGCSTCSVEVLLRFCLFFLGQIYFIICHTHTHTHTHTPKTICYACKPANSSTKKPILCTLALLSRAWISESPDTKATTSQPNTTPPPPSRHTSHSSQHVLHPPS